MQGDGPQTRTHGWLPAILRRIENGLPEGDADEHGLQRIALASALLSQASADLIELATPLQMAALVEAGAGLEALELKLRRQKITSP